MVRYGEIRTLKLNRILGVELTDKDFERPVDFSLQAHTQDSFGIYLKGDTQQIQIKFIGWAANDIREKRYHQSQRVIKSTAKTVTASFKLSPTPELIRWILSFGSHARVMQPQSFVDSVGQELSATIATYKTGKTKPKRKAKSKK